MYKSFSFIVCVILFSFGCLLLYCLILITHDENNIFDINTINTNNILQLSLSASVSSPPILLQNKSNTLLASLSPTFKQNEEYDLPEICKFDQYNKYIKKTKENITTYKLINYPYSCIIFTDMDTSLDWEFDITFDYFLSFNWENKHNQKRKRIAVINDYNFLNTKYVTNDNKIINNYIIRHHTSNDNERRCNFIAMELYYNQSKNKNNMILFEYSNEGMNSYTKYFQFNVFKYIYRQYFTPLHANHSHITTLPLGYTSGFFKKCDNCSSIDDDIEFMYNGYYQIRNISSYTKSSSRKYVYVFIGNTHKTTRYNMNEELIKPLNNILNNNTDDYVFIDTAQTNWKESNIGVFIGDERKLYIEESIFCPSPFGYRCPDTFRFYESIESGCIPIIEQGNGKSINYFINYFEYEFKYKSMLHEDDIFIVKNSNWSTAYLYILNKLKNKKNIDKQQKRIIKWYQTYKIYLKDQINDVIAPFCTKLE